MKTRLVFPRPGRNPKWYQVSIALALLLVMGMLLASVFLPPLSTPVHALNAPSAAASPASSSTGVTGTLASFIALLPQMMSVYLPVMMH